MKNLLRKPAIIIVPVLVLAGMLAFNLWDGETQNNGAADTNPENRTTQRTQRSNPTQNSHQQDTRSAQRTSADSDTTTPTSGPATLQSKPPANADSAITQRDTPGTRSTRHSKNPTAAAATSKHSTLRSLLANTSLTARQRAAALESLRSGEPLSREDIDAALDYLAGTTPPQGITPGQHHWIVDELITTLRADGADNAALSQSLAEIYQNRNQHIVVRDYALQHLGHLQTEGGNPQIIKATLQTALKEKQGTLAGTALLAIQNSPLKTQNSESLAIARDESYDLRSRITAMQVAGKQGNAAALPLAAETAANPDQPTALRLAAIATLADLGATDQQPLLKNLSQSNNTRLRAAATAALQKLTPNKK